MGPLILVKNAKCITMGRVFDRYCTFSITNVLFYYVIVRENSRFWFPVLQIRNERWVSYIMRYIGIRILLCQVKEKLILFLLERSNEPVSVVYMDVLQDAKESSAKSFFTHGYEQKTKLNFITMQYKWYETIWNANINIRKLKMFCRLKKKMENADAKFVCKFIRKFFSRFVGKFTTKSNRNTVTKLYSTSP